MENQAVLYKSKYQILQVILFLSSIVFGVFMLINFLHGRFAGALLELLLLTINGVSIWKLKSILASNYASVFTVTYTAFAITIWLSIISLHTTSLTSFLWLFATPIVAYSINGVRHGFKLSALIIAATTVIYFIRFPMPLNEIKIIGWLNVILCTVSIWLAVHFYERGNFFSKKDLIKMATHDRLTGLKTRDQLYQVYKNASKNEHSLILIDIDDLHTLNATHGYLIGDVVLISMAKILLENLPNNAHAFRMGGDEFAIFLPNSQSEPHIAMARCIFAEMLAYQTVFKNHIIKVQVSMSMASLPSDGNNLDALIKKADELMKQAKLAKDDKIAV